MKLMAQDLSNTPVAGVDVGDRWTHVCIAAFDCEMERFRIKTEKDEIAKFFAGRTFARVVLEAGSNSVWISELLKAQGHQVMVIDTRQPGLKEVHSHKTDRSDAEALARMALSPHLLREVQHAPTDVHKDRELLGYRATLVKCRTMLVNHMRGALKVYAIQVPRGSVEAFPKRAAGCLPAELKPLFDPMLEQIRGMTREVKRLDLEIQTLLESKYPEPARRLTQVFGVGPVIALSFILKVYDPKRFAKNRQVGSYLGLTPKVYSSGDSNPQLRITKAGDRELRRLLVQGAHRMLSAKAPDSDLKRFGQAIAERGGKNAKKRATVAVARRLAVLLLALWKSGKAWEPLLNQKAA